MIRTSKHSTKFSNKNKQYKINKLIQNYKTILQKYINIIWNKYQKSTKIPKLLESKLCNSIITERTNDARLRQCAAKQALAIVEATLKKHKKRLYKLKQLQKENKDTKYLQRKINLNLPTKPILKKVSVELDPRFIHIKEVKGKFNLFIQINSIGNKERIRIPIKHTKVSNKWLKEGKLINSIRIKENSINLYFKIDNKPIQGTKVLGADQGILTCLSLSDGQITIKDKHNYDLDRIQAKLSRKKKGSKGFRRVQEHRKNYINWSIKQLNFENVREVKLEKIKNIRKGKNSTRKLSHWTYPMIKNKLIMFGEEKGFLVKEQDNKFRSQRCSSCGWTHKSNRKGKTFKCMNCEFIADSDLNAAFNHEIELIELSWLVWHSHINRSTGFYWLGDRCLVNGQEFIVPDVEKVSDISIS